MKKPARPAVSPAHLPPPATEPVPQVAGSRARKAAPGKAASRSRPEMEELEPRLLFSADLSPLVLAAGDATGGSPQTANADVAHYSSMQAAPAAQAEQRLELVFVDRNVPNADELVQSLLAQQDDDRKLIVYEINDQQDGVQQISQVLAGYADGSISALHLITHGKDGTLQIGATSLNEQSLGDHAAELAGWGGHLTASADMLLYGCDVAADETGRAFVADLSLLTGADVAASTNLTGSQALGGDWNLEYHYGTIQTASLGSAYALSNWNAVLATVTLRDGLNGYASTSDTYLNLLSPAANNSAATALSAGRDLSYNPYQTLIKFDNLVGTGANQVPTGSVVTSATLTVYMVSNPTFTNPTYDLYRMVASWTDTSTYSSMGSGVDGSEYVSTPDQSITDSGNKSYTFASNAAMLATVQGWIDSPSSNQGWYIFCNDVSSTATFASSENATTANRPTLTITYTPPTPPSMDLDASNNTAAGNNYGGAFVENAAAVKIADTDATLSAGSSSLTGMTATISNLLDGSAEALAATTSGTNISASYSAGVLTLSGTDTAANYLQVLKTITYNNTSDTPSTTARTINIVLTDANGQTATATSTISVTATNDAPTITSGAAFSVQENATAVTTVTASDPDGPSLTYSISGGADAAKFSINSTTGVLTFVSAPDYENPTDSGVNNVYDVIVKVSDGSLIDTKALAVTVTDVSSSLIVTTTADTNDSGLGASFTAEQLNAVNGGTDGKISLREAMIAANNTAGTDTISFAIASGTAGTGSDVGAYVITATSALPTITEAVVIDASTQSGYVAGGLHTVVLDGNDAAAYGLQLSNTSDGSTIRGLVIRNFINYGIYMPSGSDSQTLVGNYIGSFYADGSNAGTGKGNATAGIFSQGANAVIGGTTAADRNVISGNSGGYGIYLSTGADGTVIKGNYIGTNAAGTSVFSTTNPNYGIMVETSATNITIGGTAAGAGNVVSGNLSRGMWITTTGTVTIQGNYVGTDYTGTVDLGNAGYGIYLDDLGTAVIGGTAAGAGNVISGNNLGGIYAANSGVTVQGNIIGLNAAGTAALGNTGAGIEVRTIGASTIGGTTAAARNVISGNSTYGIDIESHYSHVIKGNYIGLGSNGSTLLGNGSHGIYINISDQTIGGKTAGDGNIIAGNGGAGIGVAAGTGTLYYRNSIYSNTGLGIDLGNDGVTVNDYGDGDGGVNYQNNYAVISSAVVNGTSTTITGSIDWYAHGTADTIYIELYSSPTLDPTGYGEGKTYLGYVTVTTDPTTGDATFSTTVTGVSAGDYITAVANVETSFIGGSEFSPGLAATSVLNAPKGKLIWTDNDQLDSWVSNWTGTSFTAPGMTGLNQNDDVTMMAVAEAPTRDEFIVIGSADVSGRILAAVWNGSSWTAPLGIPVASPGAAASQYNSFAVAYESQSGDAMLVWDNGTTGTTGLSYAVWNGTSWSAINTITAPASGEPYQMRLASSPIADQMVLAVTTNTGDNNYALVWNGSSWGNAQTLGTNSSKQYFEINVAYESQSGQALVVYDNSASNSSSIQYRTWDGSSWSSEQTLTAPAGITATSDVYVTAIASDALSDRIGLAVKDAANEVWLAVWSGSSWGSTLAATTSGVDAPDHHATMAVAFESQSGDLLAVYGKSAGPNIYYRTWTSGGGWSAEGTGPSNGGTDIVYATKLYSDPYSNAIMMGVQDGGLDLNMTLWDGSAWGTTTTVDSNTGEYYRENFAYAWNVYAPPSISNLASDTLAYTERGSAAVIDQSTSAVASDGDGLGWSGGNLTVSFAAGSTSTEDVLGIRNQGTGAGQIGVSGSNVTYAGTVIGTYSGGSSGSNLVITLNSSATDAAVSALVSNITYVNTNTTNPSTSSRTVRYVATNSRGSVGPNVDTTVTVTAIDDAPTITSNGAGASASVSVPENITAVTTVTATDVDSGTLTYSISGGADAAKFTINSSTGVLTFVSAPDYENPTDSGGNNVYDVIVQVSDGNSTDTQAIAVTVTAVNDNAPVITSNGAGATASVNAAENSTAVTTVTATDADAGSTLTYSISGGADAAKFTINSSTGVLTFVSAPDRENPTDSGANNVYDVTVQVSDGTNTDTQAIAVTVTDVNDNTPVITSNGGGATAAVSVTENTTAVTTVTATDADSSATLSYSISGGGDAAKFTINATTGVLTFVSAPDYENPTDSGANNVYDVTVQVSDGTNTDTQAIAVTVTNTNDNAPVVTSDGGGAAASVNVAENSTAVTTVTATDADAGSTLSYSISGGADAAKFTINSSTGVLTFVSAPDYENPTDAGGNNVYDVTVQVSDGTNTDTQAIAVTVTAVNDNTPVITSNGGGATASVNVAENTTAVTTVTAADADVGAGSTLTYLISGGADAAKFTINSSTGVLTFVSAPNYESPADAGGNNVYDVTVQVSDGTNTDTQAIAVTVTDVNDNAPVITSDGGGATAAVSVAENTTAVTTVTATDVDTTGTLTYSISGGADAAKFTINSSTGVLTFVSAPNYEAPTDAGGNNVYDVTVQVSDGTNTDTQVIAVTVTAVNDNTPVITSDGGGATAAVNVAENTTAVTTVTATDADVGAGSTLTYSISGGADAAKFTINATTGVLTFVSAPDYENPTDSGANNVYDVTVQVSDGTNTDTQAIAVTVTNTNDNAPVITSNGGGATASVSAAENTTAVTTVTATDADAGSTLSYSISGGADAAKFTINSSTGVLTFVSAPDYENPTDSGGNNVYDVIVQVSDGTNTDTQAIAVTVTDTNDNAPVITSDGGGATAAVNVAENTTAVTTVTATDVDTTGTLTYSISGGVDAAKFAINSSTGALTLVSTPNYESPTDAGGNNVYDVTVQVSDGVQTDTQAIAVTVTDTNDNAPVITSDGGGSDRRGQCGREHDSRHHRHCDGC